MDEYSRPATLEDLKALISALNREQVDYLLIGGYALFAHGYHRATTDIDILVPATWGAGKNAPSLFQPPQKQTLGSDDVFNPSVLQSNQTNMLIVQIKLSDCRQEICLGH